MYCHTSCPNNMKQSKIPYYTNKIQNSLKTTLEQIYYMSTSLLTLNTSIQTLTFKTQNPITDSNLQSKSNNKSIPDNQLFFCMKQSSDNQSSILNMSKSAQYIPSRVDQAEL